MNNYKELKRYVLDNRHDAEAVREYMSRPKPDAITIPVDIPWEDRKRLLEEAINKANT